MLFDQLKEPLDGALNGARRMAELSQGLLNGIDDFLEDLRRLRRDFPRFVEKALAAFHGEPRFAADLKHELDCVQDDAFKMVAWAESTWAELCTLFAASGTDTNASLRYGQARENALQMSERHRQAVFASCNRTFSVANRICAESDKVTIAKANSATEPADAGKDQLAKETVQPPKRRGPKPKYDSKADKRIFDLWKKGSYRDFADLAKELHLKRRDIEKAIDRHEKRSKPKE